MHGRGRGPQRDEAWPARCGDGDGRRGDGAVKKRRGGAVDRVERWRRKKGEGTPYIKGKYL